MFGLFTPKTNHSYDSLDTGSSEGTDSDRDHDLELKSHSPSPPATRERTSTLTWCTLLICILCTLFNAASLFTTTSSSSTNSKSSSPSYPRPLSSYTRAELAHLNRPSQFIGLDAVPRPIPPIPRNFTNFPILLTQVDETRKEYVFDEEEEGRGRMTYVGGVVPEERRVLVSGSKGISTIVQFRAIDYGMEICDLELVLPASSLPSSASSSLSPIPQLKLPATPFSITLHRLAAPLPLDPRTLSWATKPARVSTLGDVRINVGDGTGNGIEIGIGTRWVRRFACPWDEVLSFEVECTKGEIGEECEMEWWQDHETEGPVPGLFITQRATK